MRNAQKETIVTRLVHTLLYRLDYELDANCIGENGVSPRSQVVRFRRSDLQPSRLRTTWKLPALLLQRSFESGDAETTDHYGEGCYMSAHLQVHRTGGAPQRAAQARASCSALESN